MQKKHYLIFLFIAFLFPNFAHAIKDNDDAPIPAAKVQKSVAPAHDLTLSLGNLCEHIGKIQTNAEGKKNVCGFLPYLALSFETPLVAPAVFFSPQVGFTFPKSGRDPHIKRMALFALANAKYKTNYVNLHAGLGFYFTRIWGTGGEAVLNNGHSTDSFTLPSEAAYSRNFIVNVGTSVDFSPEWSAELHSYIFNLTASEDRAFSLGLNATYHFGEVL